RGSLAREVLPRRNRGWPRPTLPPSPVLFDTPWSSRLLDSRATALHGGSGRGTGKSLPYHGGSDRQTYAGTPRYSPRARHPPVLHPQVALPGPTCRPPSSGITRCSASISTGIAPLI